MSIVVPVPTGPPKREILELAFDARNLAGYEFDITPEEIATTLRQLNAMMREWPFSLISYEQPSYGAGLPEDLSGIPDDALPVVAGQLAMRMTVGKPPTPEFARAAARSLLMFQSQQATIPAMPLARNTVRGAGNRQWSNDPFINEA